MSQNGTTLASEPKLIGEIDGKLKTMKENCLPNKGSYRKIALAAPWSHGCKIKKSALIIIFGIMVLSFTFPVLAEKSWRIHTPRGGVVSLVVTDQTLKNIRIYGFDFVHGGDAFSITAALLRPSDGSLTLSISFYEDGNLVQGDYLDITAEKRTQEVYCPESFDQIVVD